MEEKIDFVITWVDGADNEWLNKKSLYRTGKEKIDDNNNRYRDWETLKYLLRSIEENALWVNKVFLITDNQIPDWIDTECSKLRIVNHEDFIPKEYLPTFNSCTIEVNMHRIEDLSENFVYFNDDMILNKPVKTVDFFENNLPKDSLILSPICASDNVATCINYNCMKIINRHFVFSDIKKRLLKLKYGKYLFKNITLAVYPFNVGIRFHHLPTAYKKSIFQEIWNIENELLSEVCYDRFRCERDVSQWLMQFWQLASGKYLERSVSTGKYYDLANGFRNAIREIEKPKHKLVCLNDCEEVDNFEEKKRELIQVLQNRFPHKSIFEK